MNENMLNEVLSELYVKECSVYENLPAHKFSLRHRLAMNRIFARYEKNKHKAMRNENKTFSPTINYEANSGLSLKKRMVAVFIVIICAVLFTGWIAMYVSKSFHGTVYNDNTHLFAVNNRGCPQTIERKYRLSELPLDFELLQSVSSPYFEYSAFSNKSTGQEIAFSQYVKTNYLPHYNTEHHEFEAVVINDYDGLCIDFGDSEHYHTLILWDCGDYILELVGDLPKETLLNLAKSAKLL